MSLHTKIETIWEIVNDVALYCLYFYCFHLAHCYIRQQCANGCKLEVAVCRVPPQTLHLRVGSRTACVLAKSGKTGLLDV